MKSYLKRLSAGLLVLFIVISLVSASAYAAPASSKIYTTPTGYDEASDVQYVTSNVSGKQVIANWGARGEDCVFLSTYAQNFYTGEYSFSTLSSLSGGTTQSNAPSSQLFSELQELMTSKHTFYTYYDGNQNVRNYYKYTDCVSNDTSKVALLYRGGLETSSWNSGNIWNQEHMWPKSKLSNSEQIGDIMQLRPANPSENSSRGNTAYGEGSKYYNPGPSVRGDCARLVLYMYVRWGVTNKMWSTGGVIESLDVLLKWMEEDPVDTWEMGRNDSVQSITGTRNVFVDYPELAWLLFGKDVPAGITTPSDNDGVTANPGGNTPPVTQPPATQPPVTQPPATQAPVTQPPVSQPSGGTTITTPPASQPAASEDQQTSTPASQPGTSEGTQTSTPGSATATKPAQPAPMATNPIAPPTLPKDDSPSPLLIIGIIVGVLAVGAGAYFLITYFVVIKPKQNANATTPVEDVPAETLTEETFAEETPTEPTDEIE